MASDSLIHLLNLLTQHSPSDPSGQTIHLPQGNSTRYAYLLKRIAIQLPSPLVVFCSDEDEASQLADDLSGLNAPRTLYLPDDPGSPYQGILPSLSTRLTRLRTLRQLFESSSSQFILVTTPRGFFRKTLSRSEFNRGTLHLQIGQDVKNLNALVETLMTSGYQRTDFVEDPGTFSIRGSILDLFPIHLQRPIRIEFFDTEIERIREFDPESQRTSPNSTATSWEIPPAREIFMSPSDAQSLREAIKVNCDDRGVQKKDRDPVLESIKPFHFPPFVDFWTPFSVTSNYSLLDSLDPTVRLVWIDQENCRELFYKDIEKATTSPPDPNHILPDPAVLYSLNQAKSIFSARGLLNIERFEKPNQTLTARFDLDNLTDFSKDRTGNLTSFLEQGYQVAIYGGDQGTTEKIRNFISPQQSNIQLFPGSIQQGFVWKVEKTVLISVSDFFGTKKSPVSLSTDRESTAQTWAGLRTLSDLSEGDLIVHIVHGIGRYLGLSRMQLSAGEMDFLTIEYAKGDRLHLPVSNLNQIQKFSANTETRPLDRLGSAGFEKTKAKVKDSLKKLAFDLVDLFAKRKLQKGWRVQPVDSAYFEFEAQFPHSETADQSRVIDEIFSDLESSKVMDRLVCGDVGFGKTEVAMRAAYRVAASGKQVAVLVPTTILAYQHELTFKKRFQNTAIRIESISRFKSSQQQKETLAALKSGKIDILIGTHRILSKDLSFNDLGLVIVDEEHRFGVEHKEKLKTLKLNTHFLTLTATPIPRTLQLTFTGLRDISLLKTPPVNRLPIRTLVAKKDPSIIRSALESELQRGGQVYFLHNRVQTINREVLEIEKHSPGLQIGVGHAQMSESSLEKVMNDFFSNRIQVLVCTSIIESGLDISNANTIIIDHADHFGLGQLYQLRGRVGRSNVRGVCYLLVPELSSLTDDARKRLDVIQKFVELGSGFSVASHDLDIRGGGNILGPEQSGHLNSVGFELYSELLEEAIQEIRSNQAPLKTPKRVEPEIKIPFSAFLDSSYIPNEHQRLSFYRRLSGLKTYPLVEDAELELKDRFGPLPPEAEALIWLIRVKILLTDNRVTQLTVGPEKISISSSDESHFDARKILLLVAKAPGKYRIFPENRLVLTHTTESIKDLFVTCDGLFRQIVND